jgi:hypothetical protein
VSFINAHRKNLSKRCDQSWKKIFENYSHESRDVCPPVYEVD